MDREFDMVNFEEALKQQADQFKMIPSRRVWHGVYNDLHPGSKLPSMAMALVLLFTLLGIGHLNNTSRQLIITNTNVEKNSPYITIAQQNSRTAETEGVQKDYLSKIQTAKENSSFLNSSVVSSFKKDDTHSTSEGNSLAKVKTLYPVGINSNNISSHTGESLKSETINLIKKAQDNSATTGIKANDNEKSLDQFKIDKKQAYTNNDKEPEFRSGIGSIVPGSKPVKIEVVNSINSIENDNSLNIFEAITSLDNKIVIPATLDITTEELIKMANLIANENNENLSANKKSVHSLKKRNRKISWVYFVTPAISTVSFNGEGIPPLASSGFSPIIVQQNQKQNGMLYNARLGYKAGAQMLYSFSKKGQLVAGVNLSNSGYNIISNQVHPTFATLMLKDEKTGLPYSHSYITHYGNGQGQNQISLSNYSLQFSVPVGIQYALFENSKIKIDMASTIEPSLILNNNSFIISSDERYYVKDPGLIRKINFSGNFGSFVTFKSNKINWQIGPSVRYQLLSTYKNSYPIKEHLIDYGIRIGISR